MATAVSGPVEIPAKHRVALSVAIFLFACAVIVARRPDAIFNAQFFAEDGRFWFADAYNLGWLHALFLPRGGYLQTFPRLGAALALLVPFVFAPLVLNVIAIAVQALPVNLLLSSRSAAWGGLRFRAILAVIYLVLPNNEEMSGGITESQWILALCAFMLLVASPPRSRMAKVFDFSIFALSSLTGPFCILLVPIAIFLASKRSMRTVPLAVMASASLIQGLELLTHPGTRSVAPLGANPEWFIRLLSGQVYLGTIFGASAIASIDGRYMLLSFVFVALVCTPMVVSCFRQAPINMRLFLVFSAMVLLVSLASPYSLPPDGTTVWQLLAAVPGRRYWFFPTLAFAWALVCCVRSRSEAARIVSRVLVFLMCIGLFRDFRHPAFEDLSFQHYAQVLQDAPHGTVVTIPHDPRGWDMRLVKR
jgi:hypothetical protein